MVLRVTKYITIATIVLIFAINFLQKQIHVFPIGTGGKGGWMRKGLERVKGIEPLYNAV